MSVRILIAAIVVSASVVGCTASPRPLPPAEQAAIRNTIVSQVHSYSRAVSTLDSGLIAPFYAEDFRYYPDTLALSRDSLLVVIDNLRRGFRRYDVTADTIDVTPVGRDVAVAPVRFHTLQTDTLGVDSYVWGRVTWVFRRDDGDWRLIHGQSFHLADTGQ